MKRFVLDRAFEESGIVSDPAHSAVVFAGKLQYSVTDLIFEQSPSVTPPQVATAPPRDFRSLQGATSDGNCSLFGLLEEPGPRTFLQTGDLLATAKFHIKSCVIGMSLDDETEAVLTSATLRYAGLEAWLPSGFGFTTDPQRPSTINFSHSLPAQPSFEIEIASIGCKVALTIACQSHHNRMSARLTSDPQIILTPTEPKSLNWFVELADRLENFFSLMLGVSTALTSMEVIRDRTRGWFIAPRIAKAQPTDSSRWLECSFSQLSDALSTWFSFPASFREIESLIYGTIRNSSLFVETEFLSLAQALESFHRVTDDALVLPHNEFREIKRVLSGLFDFFFRSEPQVLDRLNQSISHANELTFRSRLELLLWRVNSTSLPLLVGSAVTFVDVVKDTRNFFTHPGIQKKPTVATEPLELFRLNRRMHALLRLLVLKHVGFQENQVLSPVTHELRFLRWK